MRREWKKGVVTCKTRSYEANIYKLVFRWICLQVQSRQYSVLRFCFEVTRSHHISLQSDVRGSKGRLRYGVIDGKWTCRIILCMLNWKWMWKWSCCYESETTKVELICQLFYHLCRASLKLTNSVYAYKAATGNVKQYTQNSFRQKTFKLNGNYIEFLKALYHVVLIIHWALSRMTQTCLF